MPTPIPFDYIRELLRAAEDFGEDVERLAALLGPDPTGRARRLVEAARVVAAIHAGADPALFEIPAEPDPG
jgi:hypothetical protein